MKRISGIAFLLLCLSLSACGNTNDTSADEAEAYTEATPVPTESISQNSHSINDAPIELAVYSQLSSWYGEQEGWFAKLLLDRFNVKLQYMQDFDTEESPEALADIIVLGDTGSHYEEIVDAGLLLDWEADGLLEKHGSYILENMSHALEYNRSLTPEKNRIFGFGHSVVPDSRVCEDFFYVWDIRWDLYKELGYPEVKDLNDFVVLLEDMKELCPTDDKGNEAYAMSLWPDWDSSMVMPVKSMATAYYGYDEFHFGLYDSRTGTFHGALEENGPYLEMLRFFNTLYRKELLDPDSRTQSYEDMLVKLQDSGIFFSIFNYAGSVGYNTEEHQAKNKYMASLLPREASPAAYGLSVYGGNRVWAIGSNSQYPELCMEIINWLCTPEGIMTCEYGPKGVTWDYDAEGNTYFTELGKTCYYKDRYTMLTGEYAGYDFAGGVPQINNITWSLYAPNPDSNGETYDCGSWKSNIPAASCRMEQDWRDHTGASTVNEYIKAKNYVVIPKVPYKAGEKDSELEAVWNQVADCIVNGSWDAIYAESDEEFERIVSEMLVRAEECGYEKCMAWCRYEAMRRHELEKEVRGK